MLIDLTGVIASRSPAWLTYPAGNFSIVDSLHQRRVRNTIGDEIVTDRVVWELIILQRDFGTVQEIYQCISFWSIRIDLARRLLNVFVMVWHNETRRLYL